MPDELAPPRKSVELQDPGAKDLAESSSDEHFSDASEGRALQNARNEATSPIPITRVERVDDEPSHGEVPGTDAYKMRTQDAVPDEVEIVPDGLRSRSTSRVSISDRPVTPGGTPIPKTVVEKIDPDQPGYGDVPGTEAHKLRLADAEPDVILKAPQPPQRDNQGSPTASFDRSSINDDGNDTNDNDTDADNEDEQDKPNKTNKTNKTNKENTAAGDDENNENNKPEKTVSSSTAGEDHEGEEEAENQKSKNDIAGHITDNDHDEGEENDKTKNIIVDNTTDDISIADSAPQTQEDLASPTNDAEVEDDDGFGDDGGFGDDDGFGDFDEFEEGGEGDDDFGDFDDGFQQGEDEPETTFDNSPDQVAVPAPPPGPPVLDFAHLTSTEDIVTASQPYINDLYPGLQDIPSISASEDARSIFLSERSQSLWTQLVAPPPLQPPDWVRSRIRRLFLVSLGVPVDLDEILPASKQKKLILPSINIPGEKSPRPSSDNRSNALDRVKRENASSTSVESSNSKPPDRKRKGPPPPPELDVSATSMLCSTTEAALQNFTDEELAAHVEHLKGLQVRANEVFEYWQKRMESALGDKDAFEQVIESLVAHAKKLR